MFFEALFVSCIVFFLVLAIFVEGNDLISLNDEETCISVSGVDICALDETATVIVDQLSKLEANRTALESYVEVELQAVSDAVTNAQVEQLSGEIKVIKASADLIASDDAYLRIYEQMDLLAQNGGGMKPILDGFVMVEENPTTSNSLSWYYSEVTKYRKHVLMESPNYYDHSHYYMTNRPTALMEHAVDLNTVETDNTMTIDMGGANYFVVNTEHMLAGGRTLNRVCVASAAIKPIGVHIVQHVTGTQYKVVANLGSWSMSVDPSNCVYQTITPFFVPTDGYFLAVFQFGTGSRGAFATSYYIALADLPGDDLVLGTTLNVATAYSYTPAIGVEYAPLGDQLSVSVTSSEIPAFYSPDIVRVFAWVGGNRTDDKLPNGDLLASVSRDNGTTWVSADLLEGPSLYRGSMLSGVADLAATPSGTAVKLKFETNATFELHGTAVTFTTIIP